MTAFGRCALAFLLGGGLIGTSVTAFPKPPEKLEIGESYTLTVRSHPFTPVVSSYGYCNALGAAATNCFATADSVYHVVRVEGKTAYVRFSIVGPFDKSVSECRNILGIAVDTEICKQAIEKAEQDQARLVGLGILYSVDSEDLRLSSQKYNAPVAFTLKAVLVPQKLYRPGWQHSADPTIGIAISGLAREKQPSGRFGYDTAFEFGAGMNQVSIGTADGVRDRIGLSAFAGFNFKNFDNNVGLGIYFGIDWVQLKEGEQFAGAFSERRAWIGLVLGTELKRGSAEPDKTKGGEGGPPKTVPQ